MSNNQGADDFIERAGTDAFLELKSIPTRHPALAQHRPWWENWVKGKNQESKELAKIATMLQPVEPWDTPVDGLELLEEIRNTFKRFIVTVQPDAIVVETLWVVFAHMLDAFGISPMLAFWSPLPGCGKSNNLALVGRMAPLPLYSTSLTPSVTFRTIDKYKATLLIDEFASVKETNPDLMMILRASHMRDSANVMRNVGDTHEPTPFSTWAAKAYAVTKDKIEPALASRSLIVNMQRKTTREKVERYSPVRNPYPEIVILRRKAARWAMDNFNAVRDASPELPDIENRDLDNFEPLFQVACVAGGEWPGLITKACLKMLGDNRGLEQELSVELLRDIKSVFDEGNDLELDDEKKSKKLPSLELIRRLVAMEDRPWAVLNRGNQISQSQVARILRDFFIYPRKIRVSTKTPQGYIERQFEDAFRRYLPPEPPDNPPTPLYRESQLEQKNDPYENNNLDQKTQLEQGGDVPVGKSDLTTENYKQGSPVPVANPVYSPPGTFPVDLPASLDRFTTVKAWDTEFCAQPGHNPVLHGAGLFDLRTGEVGYIPRGEFNNGRLLFGNDSLTMAFAGTQDAAGLLEAGKDLPDNYIDVETLAKLAVNVPRLRKSPSLIESLDIFGIPHSLSIKEKKAEQKRYAKPVLTDEDRRDIRIYCPNDAKLAAELFLKLPGIDMDQALRFGEYIKENARIAFRGIPVDTPLFEKIQRNRKQIRLDLIRQSPAGEVYTEKGVRSIKNIEAWINKNGFENWERTEKSDKPCLQEAYLKKLIAALGDEYPEETAIIKALIDLVTELKDFQSPPFGVAADGRSHADQRPFGAGSGRNGPKKYIFNARKWWRYLIKPVKGTAIVSLDFAAEEPAIAAYLSGDESMIAAYEAGDIYQPIIDAMGVSRKSAKACVLGVQYGRGKKSLAEKEGIPYSEAEAILKYHRKTYRKYWEWSDGIIETIKRDRVYTLPDGWAIRIDDTFSDDSHEQIRTIRNFPVQGTGGTILRSTVLVAAKENISIIGTHHDSIAIEAPVNRIAGDTKTLEEIMRETSKRYLGKEIRVTGADKIYEDRFEDEDGKEDWERISETLKNYE